MKKIFKPALLLTLLTLGFCVSCDEDNPLTNDTKVTKKTVIENYAKMVYQGYEDSYNSAVEMQKKISAFTTNPTEATFKTAKDEWLKARDIYGLTEVYRGSNGPIDSENSTWGLNNEGQLNAWPLDESYIDYVTTSSHAYAGNYGGIIASTETINKSLLTSKNEKINDKSISTGWHAIEFLLWGQDETIPARKLPGQRPLTDYTTDAKKERRKTYLNVVTEILVEDLKALKDTWATGGTYYKVFMKLKEEDALHNIINGPHFLAASELSNERMLVPAVGTDGIDGCGQEDEHSCFSDNTHRDVYTNAKGINNVIYGTYGNIKGASFYDLVKQADANLAEKLKVAAKNAMDAITKIDQTAKAGTPFDLMIVNENASNPGIVMKGDELLKKLGEVINESAQKLGITPVIPE